MSSTLESDDHDNCNFLQRFNNYLKTGYFNSEYRFNNLNSKNWFVAFTSQSEWENTEIDKKTLELLERMKLEDDVSDPIRWWFIIIVMLDKHNIAPSHIAEETTDSDDLHLKLQNYMNSKKFKYPKHIPSSLDDLDKCIQSGDYPISILRVYDEDDLMEEAISYIEKFISASKSRPYKLNFQNILN